MFSDKNKKYVCNKSHFRENEYKNILHFREIAPFFLPAKAVSVQIKCGINPVILVTLDSVSLLGPKIAQTTILKGMYIDPYIELPKSFSFLCISS